MIIRTDIINWYMTQFGYKSYLEIGVQHPDKNFVKINCDKKVGIDPDPNANATYCMTSDNFFEQTKEKFDFIFIDGLHESEQVKKDIENALKCLSPFGMIMLHDCNPTTKEMQLVPRQQSEWTGDVWRAFLKMRERNDLFMFTIDDDYGCGIIIPDGEQEPIYNYNATYEQFENSKIEWMNLMSWESAKTLSRGIFELKKITEKIE